MELKARIEDPLVEYGTTTAPFGWTRGWPPRPLGLPEGEMGADQVAPPSMDVLVITVLPDEVRSTSM